MWRQARAWIRQTTHPTQSSGLSDQDSDSDLATQLPSYREQDSRDAPPASTMAVKDDAAHALAQRSTDDQGPHQRHGLFSASEEAAACISAAITTVAVAGGTPTVTAQAVTEIVTYTANSVASAPTAKAAAAAIVTAITNHAALVAANPESKFATVHRLTDMVGERNIPDFLSGFIPAIGGLSFLIKAADRLPRDHVAVTISRAVAAVANSIANAPAETRSAIAGAYKTSAKHAADAVCDAVRENGGAKRPPENASLLRSDKLLCAGDANPGPGICDAAVQETNLRAALGALREYTTNVGHVQAARALDAVIASPRLVGAPDHRRYALCACEDNIARGEGVLRANVLLTALYGVWSLHEATVPESEVARELAAGMAGAAGLEALPLGRLDAGEIRGRRDALLRVVREMDEALARREAGDSGCPSRSCDS